MPADPGHEFSNVLLQLCGPGASYAPGGAYPAINNSGYVASYVGSGGGSSPGVAYELLLSYSASRVARARGRIRGLRQLACFPARANLAQSHVSPRGVFERARSQPEHCGNRRVGDDLPASPLRMAPFSTRCRRRASRGVSTVAMTFPWFPRSRASISAIFAISASSPMTSASPPIHSAYVFIEPSYDVANDYKNGTSQHPLADVNRGEAFIKATYEAIRGSAFWESSLLIITSDEHGGFYRSCDSSGCCRTR